MISADERIRAAFAELTQHFMITQKMGLNAARLTAATYMLKRARSGLHGGPEETDVMDRDDNRTHGATEA